MCLKTGVYSALRVFAVHIKIVYYAYSYLCFMYRYSFFIIPVCVCEQVVQDMKYFQRIKWQYMILDEAQAIKSSTRYIYVCTIMLSSMLW